MTKTSWMIPGHTGGGGAGGGGGGGGKGDCGGGGEGFGGGGAGGNSITTASSAVFNTAVNLVVSEKSASVDKPPLLVLSVLLVLFVMFTGLQGLTLVTYSAQREHLLGDMLGCCSQSLIKNGSG
jgi:hypothetical protein